MVKACPECDSADLRRAGTNVRARSDGDAYWRCGGCGARVTSPAERPAARDQQDKPPRGLARKVWEYGEAGAD